MSTSCPAPAGRIASRLAATACLLVVLAGGTATASEAADCKAAPVDAAALTNPKPAGDDFLLPLGLAKVKTGAGAAEVPMVMAFRKVALSGTSFFGDERSVFEAGSKRPMVFETRQSLRAASPIFDAGKLPVLIAGKYEVSLSQYGWAMGQGDILAGLSGVADAGRANWPFALKAYADPREPCHGVFTAEVGAALALPVTDMTASQFGSFLAAANRLCFADAGCARALGSLSLNERIPANLRLPSGHEWEFIARGGLDQNEEGPAGTASLPLAEIANVRLPSGGGRARLRPIGEGAAYLSFHDLYGNASELMAGHFLAEAVAGGVGGAAVRGGSFAAAALDLRPSAVAELPLYAVDEVTGSIAEARLENTGLRLFIGVPLVGATERIGSDELERIYSAAFSKIGTGKDRAGNTFVEAKAMREIKASSEPFEDELDASDPADYLSFPLSFYADLVIGLRSNGPLRLRLLDQSRQEITSFRHGGEKAAANARRTVAGVLPGRYFVVVEPAGPVAEGQEIAYALTADGASPADTGLPGEKISREAFASGAIRISGDCKVDGQPCTMTTGAIEGYVGADDPFDTFPAILEGGQDGLAFTVSGNTAPVEIRLLDSRGQLQHTRLLDGGREGAYPVPVIRGSKAFIQVVAVDGEPTRYALHASRTEMFSKGLSASSTVAASAAGGEYSGYLHENARSLYRRVTLTGRKKLRIELTGLDRDADLAVFDADGNAVESGHRKTGTEPEVFLKDLAGGEYLIAVNRKSGAGTLAPFELAIALEAASELSPASIAAARENAKPLSFDRQEVISASAGVSYFYFDPPPELRQVSLTIRNGPRLRTVVEDAKGSVLLTRDTGTLGTVDLFAGPAAGRLYVRLEGDGAGSDPPQITIAVKGEMPPEKFEWTGTSRDGNWHIGRQEQTCFIYTYAADLRPAIGWLPHRPYLAISVVEKKSGTFFGIVSSSILQETKPVAASVRNSKGKASKIALAWNDGWLKPVRYDRKQKNFFLNSPVIRQIVAAGTLEISGTAPNGSAAYLRFELTGLKNATSRIVKECRLKENPFR